MKARLPARQVVLGDVFFQLTVLEFSHSDKHHRKYYVTQCECGTVKVIHGSAMVSGNTKSCGCLARTAEYRRLPNDRGVISQIILGYKRHAKDRDIPFRLTYDEVDKLVREPCWYCGIVGGNLKKTKNLKEGFRYNGIDRVDSEGDYNISNVVPCCGVCNVAKGRLTLGDFISLANRISAYHGGSL
jgi:hypothetical protein